MSLRGPGSPGDARPGVLSNPEWWKAGPPTVADDEDGDADTELMERDGRPLPYGGWSLLELEKVDPYTGVTDLIEKYAGLLNRDSARPSPLRDERLALLEELGVADKEFRKSRKCQEDKENVAIGRALGGPASALFPGVGASSRESSVDEVGERERNRQLVARRDELLAMLRGTRTVMETTIARGPSKGTVSGRPPGSAFTCLSRARRGPRGWPSC